MAQQISLIVPWRRRQGGHPTTKRKHRKSSASGAAGGEKGKRRTFPKSKQYQWLNCAVSSTCVPACCRVGKPTGTSGRPYGEAPRHINGLWCCRARAGDSNNEPAKCLCTDCPATSLCSLVTGCTSVCGKHIAQRFCEFADAPRLAAGGFSQLQVTCNLLDPSRLGSYRWLPFRLSALAVAQFLS